MKEQKRTGLITAAFGRHFEVAQPDGAPLKCSTRGKKNDFACGDTVDYLPNGNGQGVIVHLHPRQNLLWRSDAFREKRIAANLSCVVIVVAVEPGFSDRLISRCIAAAESQHIRPLIVLNKTDIPEGLQTARHRLQLFDRLGYEIIALSAKNDASTLKTRLQGEHSLLVGQSGMGKSTLINTLIPDASAATREISEALDSGKHTTTFARLYFLNGESWLIDSPGLQVFGLAHLTPEQLAESFIEFRPALGQCRFRNCRHISEPGCAVVKAVENGAIDQRRYEHFCVINNEIDRAKTLNPGW